MWEMWPFTNRLREATSCTTKLQSWQSLEISNLEFFFWDQHLPPRPNSPMRPPPENFIFDLDPYKQFCGKNVDLSVRVFNWLNAHPIRLSLIYSQGTGEREPGRRGDGRGQEAGEQGAGRWIYMRVGSGSRNKENNSLNSLLRHTEQKNEPENEQEC